MRIARFAVGDDVRYGIVDEGRPPRPTALATGRVLAGRVLAGRVPAGRLTAARRARPGWASRKFPATRSARARMA